MHELSITYGNRLKFVRINVRSPKYAALREKLGYVIAPTFFLLDPKGQVLREWDETLSADDVKQVLDQLGK